MRRYLLVTGLAILLGLGLSACNQDDVPPAPGAGGTRPPPPGTGGTGGLTGTGGTGGTAGGGGTAGTAGSAGAGGVGGSPLLGECSNPVDFAQLASLQPSNPRTLAASIAVTQCFNDPRKDSFIECVSAGMQTSLTSLSATCANCYGELAWCSIPFNCNVACQSDSCLLGCLNCTNYDACLEALNLCTGRTPPECSES
jgi:hypothetical protein